MLGAVLVAILGFLGGVWSAGYDSEGTFQGDTMVIYGDGSSPPEGDHDSDGDGWSDHGSEERGGDDGGGYSPDGSSRKENGGGRRRGRRSISTRMKSSNNFEYSDKKGPHGKGPYQGGSFDPRLAWYSADKRAKIAQMEAKREKYIEGGGLYWALMLKREIEKLEDEIGEESREYAIKNSEESTRIYNAKWAAKHIDSIGELEYEPQSGREEIQELIDKRNETFHDIKKQARDSNHYHRRLRFQAKVLAVSDSLIIDADTAYVEERDEDGDASFRIAEAIIDITTSVAPGVSWGRDLYEAITGHDLITGAPVEDFARAAAIFGALTGGFGSKIVKGMRILKKIPLNIELMKQSEKWKNFVEKAKKAPAIKTPRGKAVQEMGDDVLMARLQVEKGATLYRTGESGVQHTNKAQYWSLENPLEVKDYASKYGMPPADLTKYNFVETAIVKRDPDTGKLADFITRKAPPVSTNPGGSIEVVVSPGDVLMQTYHTIEKGTLK